MPEALSRVTRAKSYEQVLQAGDKLPSERDLAERLGERRTRGAGTADSTYRNGRLAG